MWKVCEGQELQDRPIQVPACVSIIEEVGLRCIGSLHPLSCIYGARAKRPRAVYTAANSFEETHSKQRSYTMKSNCAARGIPFPCRKAFQVESPPARSSMAAFRCDAACRQSDWCGSTLLIMAAVTGIFFTKVLAADTTVKAADVQPFHRHSEILD
jgi:hypothetical protein